MFEPVIAPSASLLGLLQRGRGDGQLHALAADRAEAIAALEECVTRDPRADWQVESRSLYYARLYMELEAPSTASRTTSTPPRTWSPTTRAAPVSPSPSWATSPRTAGATRC
ncbi:hypothetical protein BX285_5906 [Streptomyces sp. 1114.5]|nr:hypothetical protein BX285_5906 [Streptomyces sp. 1114.5]